MGEVRGKSKYHQSTLDAWMKFSKIKIFYKCEISIERYNLGFSQSMGGGEAAFCFVGLVLRQYLPISPDSNSGSSCSASWVMELQVYATMPIRADPPLMGKCRGLYLICYWGLIIASYSAQILCLGLNTFQSMHGKLLSQDCGRFSLNQEMGQ